MKSLSFNYENLMSKQISYINLNDVASLLDINLVLKLVKESYCKISNGEIDCPSKVTIFLPENSPTQKAWINAMPALIKGDNIVGQKWVSVCSNNKTKQLPTTIGTILLNDAITGLPLAIIDGTLITHLRTGASVAMGVKYFTNKDLDEVSLIGAGSEAKTALLAISKIRNIKKIRIYDINIDKPHSLANLLTPEINAEFIICKGAKEAIHNSKCIIACTTASSPVIYKHWCMDNAFICSLSGVRDIDLDIISASSKVIFDRSDAAIKRIETLSKIKLDGSNSIDICDYIFKNPNNIYDNEDHKFLTYLPLGLGGVDVYIANYVFQKLRNNDDLKKLNI
jgi:ornithine cyclodeaminase/alanine dehydrogenase-like protein (mu-crystallin family)